MESSDLQVFSPKDAENCKFEKSSEQTDLKALASRLSLMFRTSRGFNEMHYPAEARVAANMCQKSPLKYARIVNQLMMGEPIPEIARKFKVRESFLRAVRLLHPEVIQAGKQIMIANLEEVSIELSRRLVSEQAGLSVEKIPQVLSTVVEKLLLLSGGATQRIEHSNVPSPAELKKLFDALPQAKSDAG
jgi:hypothetical protein